MKNFKKMMISFMMDQRIFSRLRLACSFFRLCVGMFWQLIVCLVSTFVKLTCTLCGAAREKSDSQTILQLSINPQGMEVCMHELFKRMLENEDVEVNCRHCDSKTAVKTVRLGSLPPVLLAQLKKFQYYARLERVEKCLFSLIWET
eukprot:TRINITY_DN3745_c0_g1_i3.p1 TRINITY_DN3745_c0_g1~~TRINITY_DN3745_c0_g1_i3.p1  ORF type:complete len:146 (+),score=17.30 TRINITY_DN3745_c0_g1_i3:320-757(+)